MRGRGAKWFFVVDQMRRKQALEPDRVTINWLLIHHLPRLGSVSLHRPKSTRPNFHQIKTFQSPMKEEGNLSFSLMACAFYLNINEGCENEEKGSTCDDLCVLAAF
jgi:hypothetical protein